jgi:hypothetical protein
MDMNPSTGTRIGMSVLRGQMGNVNINMARSMVPGKIGLKGVIRVL